MHPASSRPYRRFHSLSLSLSLSHSLSISLSTFIPLPLESILLLSFHAVFCSSRTYRLRHGAVVYLAMPIAYRHRHTAIQIQLAVHPFSLHVYRLQLCTAIYHAMPVAHRRRHTAIQNQPAVCTYRTPHTGMHKYDTPSSLHATTS